MLEFSACFETYKANVYQKRTLTLICLVFGVSVRRKFCNITKLFWNLSFLHTQLFKVIKISNTLKQ